MCYPFSPSACCWTASHEPRLPLLRALAHEQRGGAPCLHRHQPRRAHQCLKRRSLLARLRHGEDDRPPRREHAQVLPQCGRGKRLHSRRPVEQDIRRRNPVGRRTQTPRRLPAHCREALRSDGQRRLRPIEAIPAAAGRAPQKQGAEAAISAAALHDNARARRNARRDQRQRLSLPPPHLAACRRLCLSHPVICLASCMPSQKLLKLFRRIVFREYYLKIILNKNRKLFPPQYITFPYAAAHAASLPHRVLAIVSVNAHKAHINLHNAGQASDALAHKHKQLPPSRDDMRHPQSNV